LQRSARRPSRDQITTHLAKKKMPMEKFTSGNYKAVKKVNTFLVVTEDEKSCLAMMGTAIYNSRPLSFEEVKANADLLAASPALYHACKKAEAFISGMEDEEMQDEINDLLSQVRKALSQANKTFKNSDYESNKF
jgi:arsenate reductase-like glutaredoxin family protein